MKVIVASLNPIKIAAVEAAVAELWPNIIPNLIGVKVPSGVAAQPLSDAETRQGALNRVMAARNSVPKCDYWIGIEGGIEDRGDKMAAFAWVVIAGKDKMGEARTATFYLPEAVSKLIKEGKELGEADDIVFGEVNSKEKNGAIGLLTHNAVTRTSLYMPAIIMAFIPFIRPELY